MLATSITLADMADGSKFAPPVSANSSASSINGTSSSTAQKIFVNGNVRVAFAK